MFTQGCSLNLLYSHAFLSFQKFLDDQNKRMDRVYKKSLQEEEAELKELRDMVESYIAKAEDL